MRLLAVALLVLVGCDHEQPARIFLLDGQGKLRYLFTQTDSPELIAGMIGRLLSESAAEPATTR